MASAAVVLSLLAAGLCHTAAAADASSPTSQVSSGTIVPFLVPGLGVDAAAQLSIATLPELTCVFVWENAARGAPLNTSDLALRKSAGLLLASVRGSCATSPGEGGFTYSVCVGDNVTQGGGSQYLVGAIDEGVTSGLPVHVQQFSGGQRCGETLRSARVAYGCSTTFSVLSPSEPSQCYYELRVTHPALCASPLFPVVGQPAAGAGRQAPAPAAVGADAPAAATEQSAADGTRPRRRALRRKGGEAGGPAPPPAPPLVVVVGPGEGDVPGTGGRSMGVDDSLRGGRGWAGTSEGASEGGLPFFSRLDGIQAANVPPAADAPGRGALVPTLSTKQATWALEIHHTFPRSHRIADAAAAAEALGATCSVYVTDDLRRGTEVRLPSGGGGLAAFSLAVLWGGSGVDSDGNVSAPLQLRPDARVRVSGLVTRTANRRVLDTAAVASLASPAGAGADVLSVSGPGAASAACAAAGLPPELASRCIALASTGPLGRRRGGGAAGQRSSAMEHLAMSVEVEG